MEFYWMHAWLFIVQSPNTGALGVFVHHLNSHSIYLHTSKSTLRISPFHFNLHYNSYFTTSSSSLSIQNTCSCDLNCCSPLSLLQMMCFVFFFSVFLLSIFQNIQRDICFFFVCFWNMFRQVNSFVACTYVNEKKKL